MIRIYLENNTNLLSIRKKEALPALESQVIEIFFKLNPLEEVVLGLIKDNMFEFNILPLNKFIWKIEIINLENKETKITYYSTQKVIQAIHHIFNNPDSFIEI